MTFIKKEWDSLQVKWKKAFVVKYKFKLLRDRMRWWKREIFGWMDLKVEALVSDNQASSSNQSLNEEVRVKSWRAQDSIWKNLHLKKTRKAKNLGRKWSKKVTSILSISTQLWRLKEEGISLVSIGSSRMERVVEVKCAVMNFFATRFDETIKEILRASRRGSKK